MKKIIVYFMLWGLLVNLSIPTFAQWVKQNLPPTANAIGKPKPVGKQAMWMATFHYGLDTIGKPIELLLTKNGGYTYSKSTLVENGLTNFTSIDPIDSIRATAIIVDFANVINGDYFLRKTANGGQTWQDIPYKPHTFPDLLHFYDDNYGVYMADPDSLGMVIMYTIDGGNTLTRIPNTKLPTTLPHEVFIIDGFEIVGNTIFMQAFEDIAYDKWRLWRSDDRGKTWTANPNWFTYSDFPLGDFHFSDQLHGVLMPNVFSDADHFWYTEDGGQTWKISNKFPGEKTFPIATLPGTQTFMALFGDTTRGKLFSAITNDFGKTWNTFTDVAPYTLDDTYGFPFNFADLEIVDNHTAWARFSRTELFRYDSPIPLVPEKPDLDLELTADNDGLPLYGSVKYTLTVKNRGISPATGVKINWLPPYKRTNNGAGAYAYQSAYASKGWYDSWNGVWSIDKLDAETSATATFHLFVVDNTKNVTQTAQVVACNETDLDSSPNNMSGAAEEDDEVGYLSKSNIADMSLIAPKMTPSVWTVSPNPAKENLTISINPTTENDWSIRILNSLGQTVISQKGQYNQLLNIDVKNLEAGLYIVVYQSDGDRKVEKLLVQH